MLVLVSLYHARECGFNEFPSLFLGDLLPRFTFLVVKGGQWMAKNVVEMRGHQRGQQKNKCSESNPSKSLTLHQRTKVKHFSFRYRT